MPAVRLRRGERVECVPVGRIEGSRSQFEESREDFGNFDFVYPITTKYLDAAERAPTIGIGGTE